MCVCACVCWQQVTGICVVNAHRGSSTEGLTHARMKHIHVHARTHTHPNPPAHARTYTHPSTHIRTYTHTHIHAQSSGHDHDDSSDATDTDSDTPRHVGQAREDPRAGERRRRGEEKRCVFVCCVCVWVSERVSG